MWWHKDERAADEPPTDDERLVRQCEAFLAGTTAIQMDAYGLAVPAWAWVNLLAHGSIRDITAASHCCPAGWVVELATEVLRVAPTEKVLRELQRAALIPLELDLLGSGECASISLARLSHAVLCAVEAFWRRTLDADV